MKKLILIGSLLIFCLCSNSFAQRMLQIKGYVDNEEYVRRNTILPDNSIVKIKLYKEQPIDTASVPLDTIEIAPDSILFQIDTIRIKVTPFGTRKYQRENTKVSVIKPSEFSFLPYTEIKINDYVDLCTNKITITFAGINQYNINDTTITTIKYKSKKPYKFLTEGTEPESCKQVDPVTKPKKPWWKFW